VRLAASVTKYARTTGTAPTGPVTAVVVMMSDDADLSRLAERLKDARTQVRMSQRRVADAAKISPTYVRTLENAANPNTKKPSRPSPAVIQAMARALNVDYAELLDLAGYDAEAMRGAEAQGMGVSKGESVDRDLKTIKDAARNLQHRHPFIHTQALERCSRFTTEFLAIADGTFRCTAEEEPFLTRMAYRQCQKTVKAVSFQDEEWWPSSRGRDYLDLHEEVRNKGIEITRIFIVSQDRRPALKEAFKRHIELRIPTFVMSPEEATVRLCRDFIIFDENLLRVGGTPGFAGFKAGEFTDNSAPLAQALGDFNALYTMAKNTPTEAEHILEQMKRVPPVSSASLIEEM
jgi:transcriptional regulator with XRE-family HTH domain